MNNTPEWMQDEAIKTISQEKLAMLKELVEGGKGKSQKEMLMFAVKTMKNAKEKRITFEPSELQLLMSTIRKYTAPEELQKVDELIKKAPHM